MTIELIDLSGQKPLTSGSARAIYQHPGNENILIKIAKPHGADMRRALKRNRPSVRNYGPYASWHRELSEYLRVVHRTGALLDFVAPYHGFCQTTEGVGLCVGKISDRSGNLAPTVAQVMKDGGSRQHLLTLLDDFFLRFDDSSAIATDLSIHNLVFDMKGDRLMLVDGLGDRVLIPIKRWSDFIRRRWLRQMKTALATQIAESR